jgi:HEAT repeat protein
MRRRQTSAVLQKLSGGDRRSIGRSEEVVRDVLHDPSLFKALFAGMFHGDEVVRARAADAVEKITRVRPELLTPLKKQLIERIGRMEQQEVRWHVAQMLGRVRLNKSERAQAVEILLGYLTDKSRIVKTFALQALSDLADGDVRLRGAVRRLLEEALRSGSPPMRSRARRLLHQGK